MKARLSLYKQHPPDNCHSQHLSQHKQPESDKKAELEAAIRREFALLIAEGELTPNQAAARAVEKVRETYGKGHSGA